MAFGTNLTVILITLFAVIGAVIFFVIQLRKLSEGQNIDRSMEVSNYLSDWTHGHAKGYLINMKKTPSKLFRIEFYPTDLNDEERKKDVKPEVVIARHVYTIPRGKLSSNISHVWILPKSIDEFSAKLPIVHYNANLSSIDPSIGEAVEKVKMITEDILKSGQSKDKLDVLTVCLQSLSEQTLSISTKDIFDKTLLYEDLMQHFGEVFSNAYEATKRIVRVVNFGALSHLERQKLQADIEMLKKAVVVMGDQK